MPTPEEIPPFKSNFSPDEASHWLKTLVAATGSFSDSGIFRLLSTKFEDDAPATKWYDELEDTIKQSWPAFKREFHITWISTPRRIKVAENEDAWNKFCDHKLTYDTIFIHDYPNFDHCRGVVHTWVEEHLRLGEEIKSGDVDLVRKTLTLLPTFIQASLETKYDYEKRLPADLRELCGQLQEMGPKLYKLEWLRRQKSLKETLEDEIRDIARKVDSIMNILDRQQLGRGVSSVVEPHPTTRSEANETVAWEPCSPLTSVISVDELSNVNRSQELDTPTAEQCPLPDAVEGSSFVAPLHWRKPGNMLKKEDRIAIADRAFNSILDFESVIVGNQASVMNSAFAIFDHLTKRQSRNRDSRVLLRNGPGPEIHWYLMEMMYRYRLTAHSSILHDCKKEWRISNLRVNNDFSVVSPHKYWRKSNGRRLELHRQGSGEPTVAGGLIMTFNSDLGDFRILSTQTVLFMALTSYIAESTTSPEFLKYAILSATCIKTNMLDSNTNLAMDCAIDAVKGTLKEGNILSCMLTGICIEGLSVLASVTGDNTWRSLSLSMAESAMHLKQWHGPDGVLSVGSDSVSYKNDNLKSHKGLLSRGLLVAYQRNPSNKRFRDLVRSYINVQYNALRDLSSCGSFYDVNWAGPRTRPYTHGQLDALDTIIAAIGVNE